MATSNIKKEFGIANGTEINLHGIVTKVYYGRLMAIVPLHRADKYNSVTSAVTWMNVGYGNSDVQVSIHSILAKKEVLQISLESNDTNYVGCMIDGYFNLS